MGLFDAVGDFAGKALKTAGDFVSGGSDAAGGGGDKFAEALGSLQRTTDEAIAKGIQVTEIQVDGKAAVDAGKGGRVN